MVSSKKQTFCLKKKVGQLPVRKKRVELEGVVVICSMHNPSSPESAHTTQSLNTGVALACSETYIQSELTILPGCRQWYRRRGWSLSIGWSYPVAVLSRGKLIIFIIIIISQSGFRIKTTVLPSHLLHKRGTMITRQTLPLHACPQQFSCIRAEAPLLRTNGGHLQPLPRIVDLEERCA